MTDADPAVHAAIRSIFLTTYPMHLYNTLHKPFFELKWQDLINLYLEAQNYLNTLYNTKAWAHPWTCQKFTAGLHASSPVENINAWIKSYIFNSNISLCELGDIIDKRQLSEDKNHQFILWKAISTAAFMFTSINKKLEEYLPPAILKLQKNEIHQSVFYETINEFEEYNFLFNQHLEDLPNARQITASCMIADVNKEQISSM
ncbi:hypothetical protein Glove_498g14 [Diversispora epigaea]|uniref:Uncharacterized protein n=1 Tax=Diversispora epigaea TaxID=1348612 RepID=A0A397GLY2_9GLOM|nr:hypothetical protein Glove_498g14 [Diversispora epigaea]